MVAEAGIQQEHVTGRVWTVRLDPYGRPSAGTVRLSCSRPACAEQRLSSTSAGRKAAVAHVNVHLARIRAGGGPRGEAWCGCRAADCAWHTPDADAGMRGGVRSRAQAVQCGGPVVLSVYADRVGRLWRIAETCARCAAATADCRVLDTAAPPSHPAPDAGAVGTDGQDPAARRAAVFSDPSSSALSPAPDTSSASSAGSASVPGARAAEPVAGSRKPKRWGKIAQRAVPHDLQPDVLRVELIELGDAFRAYQQRPEPDLVLLADLHERKARAFASWADATGDQALRREAHRAHQAAQTTREMHQNRIDDTGNGDGPVVQRLLTRNQAVHARTVLDYVPAHAPHPEAAVHLAVLLLTLRAARAGIGNITGQELTGWLQDDAERVLEQLVTAGWLRLSGSVTEALASRPEDPAQVTVPALLDEQQRPFAFGKTPRARISGWAQKAVGDRKLRKKKLGAATRLLALYTAAHARPDGRLGHAEDSGLDLAKAAAFCALRPEDVAEHAELLVAADWLAQADATSGKLCGQLTERALPLGGLL